jgi:DnaJ-class molecular chaperone
MQQIKWRDLSPRQSIPQPQACRWTEAKLQPSFYEVLEISSGASPEVIKAAYRALMEKHHPDKNPDHRGAIAQEISCRLNQAYAVLSDPQKRRDYDLANGIHPRD